MANNIQFGYISFGGFKLFALPENYQVISIGNKSKPIARAGGSILDIGYGYSGFTLSTHVIDASTVAEINLYAKEKVSEGSPISVSDTLYPNGKVWSGFFELPISVTGQVKSMGMFQMPINIMLNEVQLTFYSINEEIM